jgi:hypothetical protein
VDRGSRGDLAAILCTSGTIGPSKAGALSHRWFTKICESTTRAWGFTGRDVFGRDLGPKCGARLRVQLLTPA